METPTTISFGHVPSYDGLRGFAVAAVVVYHFAPTALPGGFIGVDVFFVLSGFLLTSLLVREFTVTGNIRVGRFFVRRTRRLLPAMVVLIASLAVYAQTWAQAAEVNRLRRHGIASLAYVANWLFISDGTTYTDVVVGASPLRHVWSLSIEEQFYVVLAGVLAILAIVHRGSPRLRPRVIVGSAALAIVSGAWMAILSLRGANTERLYFGSDTRAQALLIGVTLGAVLIGRPAPSSVAATRTAVAGAVVLVAVAATAHEDSTWMFRGGFLLTALAAAAVIAAAPATETFRRVLEWRPIVGLGVISYGVYLWHWPILVIFTEGRLGYGGAGRTATLTVLTLGVASLSYVLVERPIRRGFIGRRLGPISIAVAPTATIAVAVLLIVTTVGPAALGQDRDTDARPAPTTEIDTGAPASSIDRPSVSNATTTTTATTSTASTTESGSTDESGPALDPGDTVSDVGAASRAPGPLRVTVVGDSVMHTLIGGRLISLLQAEPWNPAATTFDTDRVVISNASRPACSFLPGNVALQQPDGRFDAVSLASYCDGWESDLAVGLAATSAAHADAVLLLLTNDLADRDLDGTIIEFGSPEHIALLQQFFDRLRSDARDAGATLVLLVPASRTDPATNDLYWDRELQLGAIISDYVSSNPDVAVIDLGEAICPSLDCSNPADGFDPAWRYDGLHFSTNGAFWIADWLTARLEELLIPAALVT